MAIQKGRDLLIKVDSTGSGAYLSVAGLRARRMTFNSAVVDVTNADSAGQWRELLAGAGVKKMSLSGSGIFRTLTADATLRQYAFEGTVANYQLVIPAFGTVTGPFQITALDYAGNYDGEMTYDIALESAGALTFVAA